MNPPSLNNPAGAGRPFPIQSTPPHMKPSISYSATAPAPNKNVFLEYYVLYQATIDQTMPYHLYRWIFTAFTALLYIVRVYFAQGWYIVTYALGKLFTIPFLLIL